MNPPKRNFQDYFVELNLEISTFHLDDEPFSLKQRSQFSRLILP